MARKRTGKRYILRRGINGYVMHDREDPPHIDSALGTGVPDGFGRRARMIAAQSVAHWNQYYGYQSHDWKIRHNPTNHRRVPLRDPRTGRFRKRRH